MKKRGYVTIATGKKRYYKLALNLLNSYRCFADNPLPFAIIADSENKYTAQFDDVVITSEATHSFLDKFLLLKYSRGQTGRLFADCATIWHSGLQLKTNRILNETSPDCF